MQNGEDHKYIKVVSTAKHYADYDQEGYHWGIQRTNFNANVSIQDQVEYYWPAFRTAVQVARVGSIMCSYNNVNNIPACGNDYFMNQIARKEWGFNGFIVSDCGAIGDGAYTTYIRQVYPSPQYNMTQQFYQQARTAIQGGCDTNCGNGTINFFLKYLIPSIQAGIISETDVDQSARRLFTKSIELGMLDYSPPSYYTDTNVYGAAQIDSDEHRALALNAAEQSIVLLKNDGQILPLSISGKKIALIGPHANVTQDMLSNYHGVNTLVNSNSPYDAFMQLTHSNVISYAPGCMNITCESIEGFDDAIAAANAADYAIVFLGLHPDKCPSSLNNGSACESEGWDRNTTDLPANQTLLLQQVYAANKNTILVMIHGGAINISWAKDNIPGIIDAFYPGELGGIAIRNIIYGMIAPAGKLPVTIYDSNLLTERPSIMDMSLRGGKGITYRYYTGKPLYSFGYGLYYTTFTYKYYNSSQLDIGGKRIIGTRYLADAYRNGYYQYQSELTSFIVQVTNTGKVASDCVVLGFITSENDPDAPLIKLFDFQRVYVDVGEKVNVTLSVSPESISITNKYGNERIVPGIYNLFMGDYMNNNYAHHRLKMIGTEQSIFVL